MHSVFNLLRIGNIRYQKQLEILEVIQVGDNTIRIIRLIPTDVIQKTDNVKALRELVIRQETSYPGIDKWFDNKVIPGIKHGDRISYISYDMNKPVATSILRLGKDVKFCHLNISESYQGSGIGGTMFLLMILEALRCGADRIHFSLPESLWLEKSDFFNSFGFCHIDGAKVAYRAGDKELICRAELPDIMQAVQIWIPSHVVKAF